jgi:hypothetical protein
MVYLEALCHCTDKGGTVMKRALLFDVSMLALILVAAVVSGIH